MCGASARHVARVRALPYLIYDLVALLPRNRTSYEKGILVGKEVLNADPHGIYVTRLAQEVGTGFLVSPDSEGRWRPHFFRYLPGWRHTSRMSSSMSSFISYIVKQRSKAESPSQGRPSICPHYILKDSVKLLCLPFLSGSSRK